MIAVTQEVGGGGFELPCVYYNPSLLPKEKTADLVSICTVHPELAAHVCMAHPINQQASSSTRCSLPSLPLSTGLGELSSGMLTFLSASHPPILVTLGLHVHIGYESGLLHAILGRCRCKFGIAKASGTKKAKVIEKETWNRSGIPQS